MTQLQPPAALASRRSYRFAATADLAETFDGVANREKLRGVGVSRDDIRHEVEAGRWSLLGNTTVALRTTRGIRAAWWRAIWETHGSARLDGTTALLSYGLTGWEESLTHVSVVHGTNVATVDEVRIHVLRHDAESREDELPRFHPNGLRCMQHPGQRRIARQSRCSQWSSSRESRPVHALPTCCPGAHRYAASG